MDETRNLAARAGHCFTSWLCIHTQLVPESVRCPLPIYIVPRDRLHRAHATVGSEQISPARASPRHYITGQPLSNRRHRRSRSSAPLSSREHLQGHGGKTGRVRGPHIQILRGQGEGEGERKRDIEKTSLNINKNPIRREYRILQLYICALERAGRFYSFGARRAAMNES